jgi:hypothetical protein
MKNTWSVLALVITLALIGFTLTVTAGQLTHTTAEVDTGVRIALDIGADVGVPVSDGNNNVTQVNIVTTVGDPGDDGNLATEKAIRAAIGSTGGGEINAGVNLGLGSGIYANKVGVNLQFKSLVAGSNIQITPSGTEVTISTIGGGVGEAPVDGKLYGRMNAAWSEVLSGGGGYVPAPTYSDDTCIVGQYSWDTGFYYACRAANTWDRYPIVWENWDRPSSSCDPLTDHLGFDTVGAEGEGFDNSTLLCTLEVPDCDGPLNTAYVHHGYALAENVKLYLYLDDGDESPNAADLLIATSEEISSNAIEWGAGVILDKPQVTTTSKYWVCVVSNSTSWTGNFEQDGTTEYAKLLLGSYDDPPADLTGPWTPHANKHLSAGFSLGY